VKKEWTKEEIEAIGKLTKDLEKEKKVFLKKCRPKDEDWNRRVTI